MTAIARPLLAWAAVVAFQLFGDVWLADLASPGHHAALFLILLAMIVWCAFAVVEEAERLAHLLGEPLGTLVLTLTIVTIEVALIAAVMLGAQAAPTLGRDTMFAVLMIVLNGVVGLVLLLGRPAPPRAGLQSARCCGLSVDHHPALGDRARPAELHRVDTGSDPVHHPGGRRSGCSPCCSMASSSRCRPSAIAISSSSPAALDTAVKPQPQAEGAYRGAPYCHAAAEPPADS